MFGLNRDRIKHKKCLVLYKQKRSFVQDDISILSSLMQVDEYKLNTGKGIAFILSQCKAILFFLAKGWRYDVYYIWFCDYHAFTSIVFALLFNKKSVIVVGGFDAVSIPSISYGLFYQSNIRAKLAKWAYKHATYIITVDQSLIESINPFAGNDSTTGVLHFVPSARSKIKEIPTGFDIDKASCHTIERKEQVITVASVTNTQVLHRKGVNLFLEVALRLPEYSFILIGLKDPSILLEEHRNLPNLTIYSEMDRKELQKYYCESKVYSQLSISEGLPTSLCEAMLYGCIPVGSSANGIPRAIGETGFILNNPSIDDAVELTIKALQNETNLGELASERIRLNFSRQKRELALIELMLDINI